jgi:transposase-like protein
VLRPKKNNSDGMLPPTSTAVQSGADPTPEGRVGERSSPTLTAGAGSIVAPPKEAPSTETPPDPEVSEKAVRRNFSAKYKLRILQEADRCSRSGEIGALLRREGLYSSLLSTWRRQREGGELDGLSGKNLGRPATPREDVMAENKLLRRQVDRLQRRLHQAETIIEVQKKVSALLGIPVDGPEAESGDES